MLLAAHRAGLFCIGVPNLLTRHMPLEHGDMRFTTLDEQPLETVLAQMQAWRHHNQWGPRPRVSAAVLRQGGHEILIVQHRRPDGSTYWQLPGGGVQPNERPEAAVLRELQEETNLTGRVIRRLFTIPYNYGSSTTYLVAIEPGAEASLGSDPEERLLPHQKLVAVAWLNLDTVRDNPEIAQVLQCDVI